MSSDPKKRDVALVVDDSPEALRLLTDALDGAGITVMVALDGTATTTTYTALDANGNSIVPERRWSAAMVRA